MIFSTLLFSSTSLLLAVVIPIFGKKEVHKVWAFLNLLISIWGYGLFAICLAGKDKDTADYLWRISNVGGLFIAPMFCHFAFLASNYKNNFVLVGMYIHGLIFGILTLTNNVNFHTQLSYNSYYYPTAVDPVYIVEAISWSAFVVYGQYILYRSLKDSDPETSIQRKLLFLAFLIGFGSGGASHWLHIFGFNINPAWNGFITLYTLLVSYAIFRHKLLGLDFVIRKGLMYTAVLSISTIFYFIILVVLERLFQQSIGYGTSYSIFVLCLTVLLAEPLRLKVQSFIDKKFYNESLHNIAKERDLLRDEIITHDRMKAVATLAAGMAHEIKNPLTSIKTFAEYLPKKYNDPEFRNKFSKLVVDEVDRVNSIVQQLLDFSKPTDPVLKPLSASEVLDETISLLSSTLIRVKIELTKNFDNALTAMADRNQLKQALLNLILNSIHSMPTGGALTITTKPVRTKFVSISIRDTGTGINAEHLPHIFDPFYTTKEAGTGLGLAIVHSIITKHGGKIDVQSTVGVGTTVTITLKRNLA